MVQGVERRRQPAVKAEDRVVDRRRQRQEVKEVGEVLPDVGVAVLAQALVVEAVDLGDLRRLVVASQDRHAVPVPHFQRDEQRRGLDRVVAAVDVVAHEEVVGVRCGPADAEELEEVLLLGYGEVGVESEKGFEKGKRTRRGRESREEEKKTGKTPITRTWNWPWMSPQTVTGHRTGVTLGSAASTSRAISQSAYVWRVEERRGRKEDEVEVLMSVCFFDANRRSREPSPIEQSSFPCFSLPPPPLALSLTLTSGSGSGLHRSSLSICASSCAQVAASGSAGGADIFFRF